MKSDVSLFHCTPEVIRTTPSLDTRLRLCGINTLEMQVYRSPAGYNGDYGRWEADWEATVGKEYDWCVREGYDFVGRMDDALRTPPEAAALLSMPRTLTYISDRFNAGGRCKRIEACDEMKQDPAVYPLDTLANYWYAVGGPPLFYPGLAPQALESRPEAGGVSRQWNWWSGEVNGSIRLLRLHGSLSDLENEHRPICAEIIALGPYYRKNMPGGWFRPGDDLLIAGPSEVNIRKQFKAAHALGARLFRVYALDTDLWRQERLSEPVGGSKRLQTGIWLGDRRWYDFEETVKEVLSW